MKIWKTLTGVAAAGALTLGLALVGGGAANAIIRIEDRDCQKDDWLILISDHSTCWGGWGDVDVTLNNVNRIRSGNNAGYVKPSDANSIHFQKYRTMMVRPAKTITHIHVASE